MRGMQLCYLFTGVLRLSTGCQPQNIQVNNFNHIVVSNKNGELQRVPGHQMACEAHFKTTLANHGLCVSVSHSTSLGSHVWIEFLTNAFGPDKASADIYFARTLLGPFAWTDL